jgi:hypothetical protein
MVDHLKLDRGIGTCGKYGLSLPMGVGMPPIKLNRMTVGGREGKLLETVELISVAGRLS